MNQKRDYIAPTALSVLLIAAAVIWRDRLPTDFWPIDRSPVGPNLLASGICVSIAFFWGMHIGKIRERHLHARLDAQDKLHHESHQWLAQSVQSIANHHGVAIDAHPHYDLVTAPKPAQKS